MRYVEPNTSWTNSVVLKGFEHVKLAQFKIIK